MQWLNMHGYAPYIWSAYSIVGIGLILHVLSVKLYVKKVHRILRMWIK
jgi:heme exporter protein D